MPKLKLPGWNGLILAMMYEDSLPGSHWRGYLDILPRTLNTPVFWTPAQLANLEGSSIVDHIGAKQIKSDYEKVIRPLLSNPLLYSVPSSEIARVRDQFFSFEQYRRFGSLIMAYSFTDDEGKVSMVPMADMLNHKTGFNNARLYFDQEDDTLGATASQPNEASLEGTEPNKKPKLREPTQDFLHMRTRRAILHGEELYNTYGTLPDSELLRKYGYVEELGKNRWNDVDIPASLVLSKCAAACGWEPLEVHNRRQFIKENSLVDSKAILTFYMSQEPFGPFDPAEQEETIAGGLTRDIVAMAKIFAASPSEWREAEKAILEARTNAEQERKKKPNRTDDDDDDDDGEFESDDGEESNDDEEEEKKKDGEHGEDKPARKSGGDLIPLADKAKLASLLQAVFQARKDQYGTEGRIASFLEQLSRLPVPGSSASNDDSLRTRAALIAKVGELQILDSLIADAQKMSE